MTFLPIVITAVCFSFVLTCQTTPAPGGGGAAQNKTGKKREVNRIEVTVVSNQKYDPAMNDSHMQVFRSLLEDYMKSKGIYYQKDMVQESVVNVDGNFAIIYTLLGYDCDMINNFFNGAKSSANFITDIKVKCSGRPEFSIA